MSLEAALAILDAEIEALQLVINPKKPEETSTQFCLIRAKAFGRTILREAQKMKLNECLAIDAHYHATRTMLGLPQERAEKAKELKEAKPEEEPPVGS